MHDWKNAGLNDYTAQTARPIYIVF